MSTPSLLPLPGYRFDIADGKINGPMLPELLSVVFLMWARKSINQHIHLNRESVALLEEVAY